MRTVYFLKLREYQTNNRCIFSLIKLRLYGNPINLSQVLRKDHQANGLIHG
tara:strand:- start:21 stop:173 length:153 start_codon:yes stop_codon:yes gene_type:complete